MEENPYSAPETKPAKPALVRAGGKLMVLAKVFGGLISGLAALGCFFSALALVDPRGTQLANDADPFGVPPAAGELWLELTFWVAMLCFGLWLLLRRRSR